MRVLNTRISFPALTYTRKVLNDVYTKWNICSSLIKSVDDLMSPITRSGCYTWCIMPAYMPRFLLQAVLLNWRVSKIHLSVATIKNRSVEYPKEIHFILPKSNGWLPYWIFSIKTVLAPASPEICYVRHEITSCPCPASSCACLYTILFIFLYIEWFQLCWMPNASSKSWFTSPAASGTGV